MFLIGYREPGADKSNDALCKLVRRMHSLAGAVGLVVECQSRN